MYVCIYLVQYIWDRCIFVNAMVTVLVVLMMMTMYILSIIYLGKSFFQIDRFILSSNVMESNLI